MWILRICGDLIDWFPVFTGTRGKMILSYLEFLCLGVSLECLEDDVIDRFDVICYD